MASKRPPLSTKFKKTSRAPNKSGENHHSLTKIYPSLREGPKPEQRLATLLRKARAKGVKAMDENTIDAMKEVWPKEENLDDFLAWLYQFRHEGRIEE